jgi:hypothetical protein
LAAARSKNEAAKHEHDTVVKEREIAEAEMKVIGAEAEKEERLNKIRIESDVANQVVSNIKKQT